MNSGPLLSPLLVAHLMGMCPSIIRNIAVGGVLSTRVAWNPALAVSVSYPQPRRQRVILCESAQAGRAKGYGLLS
jgi:hypothetical protein